MDGRAIVDGRATEACKTGFPSNIRSEFPTPLKNTKTLSVVLPNSVKRRPQRQDVLANKTPSFRVKYAL
jgi:hypothetical protein